MIFQLSSKILWGFRMDMDIDSFISLESLISCFKKQLLLFLKTNNLQVLYEMAQTLVLHIHDCNSLTDLSNHIFCIW